MSPLFQQLFSLFVRRISFYKKTDFDFLHLEKKKGNRLPNIAITSKSVYVVIFTRKEVFFHPQVIRVDLSLARTKYVDVVEVFRC